MYFKKYQHLERFGTTEVQGIEFGEIYVFPKIDGTNASVWIDERGDIQAGSRKRRLSLESDNAGFFDWARQQKNLLEYLKENPNHRLFGEWLVPHSLKTYREDSWRRFYVFDVVVDRNELGYDKSEKFSYMHYNEYKPLLEKHDIDYIPPISIIKNANYDQLVRQLEKNTFLIENGNGVGEGIVIKNYNFRNKYGRQIWAKIVTNEFKEKHTKSMGASNLKGKKIIEEQIANEFVTKALVEKVYAKIENEDGFNSKKIPQLLNTVFYDVIREESWNFIKKHKNPIINFKTLQHFIYIEVKNKIPKLF